MPSCFSMKVRILDIETLETMLNTDTVLSCAGFDSSAIEIRLTCERIPIPRIDREIFKQK